MIAASEQDFLTVLTETHKAFPNARAEDLVHNLSSRIQSKRLSPLKDIPEAKLGHVVRLFPKLEVLALDQDYSTSFDLLKATAKSILSSEDYSKFVRDLL